MNKSNSGLRILKDSLLYVLQNLTLKRIAQNSTALILLTGFNIAMGHLQGLADFNMSRSGHQPTEQPEEDQREICDST